MFFAQMGSNSTQTRGRRIAWLLARPKSLNALGIAPGETTRAAANIYSSWKLRGCGPKVRDELRMKPFLRFPSKPEHAAFGIAQSG
jgi:hypothetical protein